VRFSIVATVVLFCSLAFGQTAPGANVFHANGASAAVMAFDNGTSTVLRVARTADFLTGEPTTFLLYSMTSFTPDGFINTFGSGLVPNNAFRGDNPANLILTVDTSQIPGFTSTTCTTVFVPTFSQICTEGPRGVIDVDWKQNGIFSTHSVSTLQQNFGGFTMQSHGESDFGDALANGSILGHAAANAAAFSGVNRGVTLTLIKN
jgi:hypothetical protein